VCLIDLIELGEFLIDKFNAGLLIGLIKNELEKFITSDFVFLFLLGASNRISKISMLCEAFLIF